MSRKTTYIVYVDKEIMTKPIELFDAAIAHLIKKDLDIRERKRFLAQFIKAYTNELRMEVIGEWVQVRDVKDFPFRKEQDEDTEVTGGVPVDDGADGEQESGATSK